jgi:hypothetical protein
LSLWTDEKESILWSGCARTSWPRIRFPDAFLCSGAAVEQPSGSLQYDGQGCWLAQKRLSKARFVWWPDASEPAKPLEAYEANLLMDAGDISWVRAAPMWRRVGRLK